MTEKEALAGPDFEVGVAVIDLPEGAPVLGHVRGEAVVLVRKGEEVRAAGATCTHYGGPLSEGLVVGDTLRCPWHHARFDLCTGDALGAPALNPVACYEVKRRDGRVTVGLKKSLPEPKPPPFSPKAVGRDPQSLAVEAALERGDVTGLESLLRP